MALIIVGVVLVIIILWFISAQRKLVAMDENINNAMGQIGVQLSSRWDALTALLDLTKGMLITSTKLYRIRSKCVPVLIQTVPQQK